MDAVALLHRAQGAGLRVEPIGDKLRVRGPKRAEAVVKLHAFLAQSEGTSGVMPDGGPGRGGGAAARPGPA